MWAGFNCMLAAGMLREAAAMTTQISGEIIPSNVPGSLAMGYRQPVGVVARHRAVERAGHPRRARHRHAARLRQHGGPQGLRDVPRHAPADRRSLARRGLPAGRRQRRHQRAEGRGRRGRCADRAPGRAARQLHRLLARRQDHRQEVRRTPEARAAGARRQVAAGGAGRRRPRRGRERGRVRRLRQPGPDLHVDRAHRGRREGRRRVREALRRQGQVAHGRRPARGQGDPGLGGRSQRRPTASRRWCSTLSARARSWRRAARSTAR